MELALICAQQVIVLFLLIGVGTLAVKTGVLKLEHKQPLSNLLVNIVVPAMIVNSYQMEFSLEILRNLLAAFGLSILTIALGTVLTLALTARRKNSRTAIFRFASIFSNAAYMGFPLISALFGSEGLLYASAYVTVFNVLLWTLGYSMVSGSSDPKAVVKSLAHAPAIYAVLVGLAIYLLQIPIPALLAQPISLLGAMNTPLSMLITGMLIAAGDLKSIVCSRPIWKLAAVRMLVIPALALGPLLCWGCSASGWPHRSCCCSSAAPLLPSPRCLRCSSATMSSLPPGALCSPPCSASSPCRCARWCSRWRKTKLFSKKRSCKGPWPNAGAFCLLIFFIADSAALCGIAACRAGNTARAGPAAAGECPAPEFCRARAQ